MQYLFVGVIADRNQVEKRLFTYKEVTEWSCSHVDDTYRKQYCADCGALVTQKHVECRYVDGHFTQDGVDASAFHYGKTTHIQLHDSIRAFIYTGKCEQRYAEEFLDPIELPTEQELLEFENVIDLLRLRGDVSRPQIHYIDD